MLLELKNTTTDSVEKLMSFAKDNGINLSLLDDGEDYHLPGEPLTDEQLNAYLDESEASGTTDIDTAHQLIRNMFNGD